MGWRDSAEELVATVAATSPEHYCERLTAEKLAVLARAFKVRSTGRKADVAALVVARAELLDRLRIIGDDPAQVARTFKAESLKTYARELGCFTGLNKYGLAATVIGRRTQIYRALAADLKAVA